MQLTVNNLGKQYKRDFWGLKDFSLDIKPGILGLLGPNGAGKSTLAKLLAGHEPPEPDVRIEQQRAHFFGPARRVRGFFPARA